MVEFYVPLVDDLLVSESEDCFTVPVTIVIRRPDPRATMARPIAPAPFVRASAPVPFIKAGIAAIFQRQPSTAEMRRCS